MSKVYLLDNYDYNLIYNFSFKKSNSDIIISLVNWQFWWWFWFCFLISFYYILLIRTISNRSLKFYPKINNSFRSHGKWGDLIICVLPVIWCANILTNSSTLLKLIEWQSESSMFTLRVRGKQWYWVYKIDFFKFFNKNINISVGENKLFNLKSILEDTNIVKYNNSINSSVVKNVFKKSFNKSDTVDNKLYNIKNDFLYNYVNFSDNSSPLTRKFNNNFYETSVLKYLNKADSFSKNISSDVNNQIKIQENILNKVGVNNIYDKERLFKEKKIKNFFFYSLNNFNIKSTNTLTLPNDNKFYKFNSIFNNTLQPRALSFVKLNKFNSFFYKNTDLLNIRASKVVNHTINSERYSDFFFKNMENREFINSKFNLKSLNFFKLNKFPNNLLTDKYLVNYKSIQDWRNTSNKKNNFEYIYKKNLFTRNKLRYTINTKVNLFTYKYSKINYNNLFLNKYFIGNSSNLLQFNKFTSSLYGNKYWFNNDCTKFIRNADYINNSFIKVNNSNLFFSGKFNPKLLNFFKFNKFTNNLFINNNLVNENVIKIIESTNFNNKNLFIKNELNFNLINIIKLTKFTNFLDSYKYLLNKKIINIIDNLDYLKFNYIYSYKENFFSKDTLNLSNYLFYNKYKLKNNFIKGHNTYDYLIYKYTKFNNKDFSTYRRINFYRLNHFRVNKLPSYFNNNKFLLNDSLIKILNKINYFNNYFNKSNIKINFNLLNNIRLNTYNNYINNTKYLLNSNLVLIINNLNYSNNNFFIFNNRNSLIKNKINLNLLNNIQLNIYNTYFSDTKYLLNDNLIRVINNLIKFNNKNSLIKNKINFNLLNNIQLNKFNNYFSYNKYLLNDNLIRIINNVNYFNNDFIQFNNKNLFIKNKLKFNSLKALNGIKLNNMYLYIKFDVNYLNKNQSYSFNKYFSNVEYLLKYKLKNSSYGMNNHMYKYTKFSNKDLCMAYRCNSEVYKKIISNYYNKIQKFSKKNNLNSYNKMKLQNYILDKIGMRDVITKDKFLKYKNLELTQLRRISNSKNFFNNKNLLNWDISLYNKIKFNKLNFFKINTFNKYLFNYRYDYNYILSNYLTKNNYLFTGSTYKQSNDKKFFFYKKFNYNSYKQFLQNYTNSSFRLCKNINIFPIKHERLYDSYFSRNIKLLDLNYNHNLFIKKLIADLYYPRIKEVGYAYRYINGHNVSVYSKIKLNQIKELNTLNFLKLNLFNKYLFDDKYNIKNNIFILGRKKQHLQLNYIKLNINNFTLKYNYNLNFYKRIVKSYIRVINLLSKEMGLNYGQKLDFKLRVFKEIGLLDTLNKEKIFTKKVFNRDYIFGPKKKNGIINVYTNSDLYNFNLISWNKLNFKLLNFFDLRRFNQYFSNKKYSLNSDLIISLNNRDYLLNNYLHLNKLLNINITENIIKSKEKNYVVLIQKRLDNWSKKFNISDSLNNFENKNLFYNDFINNYSLYKQNKLNYNRLLNVNEVLILPTNTHINIITNSFDVVHSWFIPGLGLKMDCVPGRSTHHSLYIDYDGLYYGQCAEICGRFHHHMPIKICAIDYTHYTLYLNYYYKTYKKYNN